MFKKRVRAVSCLEPECKGTFRVPFQPVGLWVRGRLLDAHPVWVQGCWERSVGSLLCVCACACAGAWVLVNLT